MDFIVWTMVQIWMVDFGQVDYVFFEETVSVVMQ